MVAEYSPQQTVAVPRPVLQKRQDLLDGPSPKELNGRRGI